MTAWLRWKLLLGEDEAALRERKKQGFRIKELENEPKLDGWRHGWIVNGFLRMSKRDRPQSGLGLSPIPTREIEAWLDREGVASPELRREATAHVEALDDVLLEHLRDKQPAPIKHG